MMDISEQQFWSGIKILLSNYHSVNKKIFDCLITKVERINHGISKLCQKVNDDHFWEYKNDDSASDDDDDDDDKEGKGNGVCSISDSTLDELQNCLQNQKQWMKTTERCQGFRITYKFLTKKLEQNIEAIGLVDFTECSYICKFRDKNFIDFIVRHQVNKLMVTVLSQGLDIEQTTRWADYVLLSKLLKWCRNASQLYDEHEYDHQIGDGGDGDDDDVKVKKRPVKSLQLVDIEKYNDLYKQLKQKHAKSALQLWRSAQESTDPLKFIYEDLAIASYLITLWRCTASEPCSFADLGCGNGLLVYILNAEGYPGYGYDIRSRKLWSFYPNNVKLIEEAIMPDDFKLPAEVDWLIGNHSDELSAWLPVISSLASYGMRYFLLPCCAFEFSGAKFQRRSAQLSTYQDFLQYTATISQKSGFRLYRDRLKIPSTKRCAIIGLERTYSSSEHGAHCQKLQEFVHAERLHYPTTTGTEMPELKIKLREKIISVHNCTQMDKQILNALVLKIFKILFFANNNHDDGHANKPGDCFQQEQPTLCNFSSWSTGGRLTIRQIAVSLSSLDLKNIKSECGGLKTLLRNKHEIFEFLGNDLIGIRHPVGRDNNQKPKTIKKRMCFFKQHHPLGCPLSDAACTFRHQ